MTVGEHRVPAARGGVREAHLGRARAARLRRAGRLTDDVVLFAELLRSCGAMVPGGAPARAVQALGEIALHRRDDVLDALRATLATDRASARLLDLVFPVFWSAGEVLATRAEPDVEPAPGTPGGAGSGERQDTGADDGARPDSRRSARPAASRRRGPSSAVAGLDEREIDDQVRRIVRALARAPGRRRRTASAGDLLDLRASLRRGLSSGELVELLHTRPRQRRTRIVVLCDVSSSMAGVTGLFLSVAHALARQARLVELGVFHVELTLVGSDFRRLPRAAALHRLHAHGDVLSGGTRIGHCLRTFLDAVEPSLTPDTVALVLSDGWDVGEPDLLAAQMRRLRERVGRVVWCDPHAAETGFDPQVRGLRAALPFVDDHLDLSGPAALRAVADHLVRHPRPRRTA